MIQLKEFCGMCRSHSWCGRECRNAPGLDVRVAKAWPAAKKTEPAKFGQRLIQAAKEASEIARDGTAVGIATFEESKARTIAIASGKLKPKKGDPKVWVTPETADALMESVITPPAGRKISKPYGKSPGQDVLDRTAHQRDYMRKKRANKKEATK